MNDETELKQHVGYLVGKIESETNGKQELADALCLFYPNCSRFQIHARIFKAEMRDTLVPYIAACELRNTRTEQEGDG